MKIALADRSLIAWMLYGCALFHVFACSIHGQMAVPSLLMRPGVLPGIATDV